MSTIEYDKNLNTFKAYGNVKVVDTIENFIRNAANDIDLIVRQRSKYIHILEETVDSYYEFSTD